MKTATSTRLDRVAAANALIATIASCGRRFFYHKGRVGRLDVDDRGRVWFVDAYAEKRIYTHYSGRWREFTEGGTLLNLVVALKDYIAAGTLLTERLYFGPWPTWVCDGDVWGYGTEMETVRAKARELKIVQVEMIPAGDKELIESSGVEIK